MIKAIIAILFIFNLLACNPIQQAPQKKSTSTQSPFSCLGSQSRCEVITDLGTFVIQFSGEVEQGRIKTELPLYIQVTFNGKDNHVKLKSVNSHLEGKDMFMGKIPVFFEIDELINNVTAETLLASCSEEVMTWRLWFAVEIEETGMVNQQNFFIDFDSVRL